MRATQCLHRNALLSPAVTATVMDGRRLSWGALRQRVAALAAGLLDMGLRPGDRVYVVALNSDRYIHLYFACAWAGLVITPGNYRWSAAEHAFAVQDCGARLLVLGPDFAPLAEQLGGGDRRVLALDETFDQLGASLPPAPEHERDGSGLYGIFYTGGTTGRPKGVMLSERALVLNPLLSYVDAPFEQGAVFLHSPPMFHLADAACIFGVSTVGGTHAVMEAFTPRGVLDAIVADRVTAIVLVPTMIAMVLDELDRAPADVSSITRLIYGASAIAPATLERAMRAFPNANFIQAYGQTELAPCATVLTPKQHRIAAAGRPDLLKSAGQPIAGVDVRIVGEDGKTVAPGAVGEIAVRSPTAMLGYWNRPDLTAETVRDGWVHTGDAGRMDEEGFVYVVDRVKDMIVSGGENVYSAEVEAALSAMPGILECAVIGVPDDAWGERVHAIVRLRPGHAATADDIIAHCRTLIARYKCPRSVEVRDAPLPLSAQGKILKTELRRPHWEGRERAVN